MAQQKEVLARRALLGGAVAAGAAATAVVVMAPAQDPGAATEARQPADPPNTSTGYRLTEHVKQYYQTARI